MMLACIMLHTGCMKWDYVLTEEFDFPQPGLFVLGEGNFQYGNASLSFYDPDTGMVGNNIFQRANGMKLGDVAFSMATHDNTGWIVVNNSHVVFAIDLDTFKEKGRITGFTSPRYIHFVSDDKAYVTQLWNNRIAIVDPRSYEITGFIECPDMALETGSTEQMVQWGKYVYVCCWSYQNRILKIDTRTDKVVAELEVGIQPNSLVLDANGKLWTITDGGYTGSPYGEEIPALHRIDAETFTLEQSYLFGVYDTPSEVKLNGDGTRLYWLNEDVWSMSVDASELPQHPVIPCEGTIYYGLTIDPRSEDIYIADAVDYQQPAMIYRYSSEGQLIHNFNAGVTSGSFCWK